MGGETTTVPPIDKLLHPAIRGVLYSDEDNDRATPQAGEKAKAAHVVGVNRGQKPTLL